VGGLNFRPGITPNYAFPRCQVPAPIPSREAAKQHNPGRKPWSGASRQSPERAKETHPNRSSKANPIASLTTNFLKSAWAGLIRKLFSPGTNALGTRNTADSPPATQSSPNLLSAAGAGFARQLRGNSETNHTCFHIK